MYATICANMRSKLNFPCVGEMNSIRLPCASVYQKRLL
jgi:hypothetical protein